MAQLQISRGNHILWNSAGPLMQKTIYTKILSIAKYHKNLSKKNKVRTYLLKGLWWADRLLLAKITIRPTTPCTKVNIEDPFWKTTKVRRVCWAKNLKLLHIIQVVRFSIKSLKDREVRTNWIMSKRSANMASEKSCQEKESTP